LKNISITLSLLISFFISCSQNSSSRDLLNKTVFILYKETNNIPYFGSAFILLKDTSYYLVTASHNIKKTIFASLICVIKYQSEFKSFPIFYLSGDPDSSVKISTYYDLAIVKFTFPNHQFKKVLDPIVVPYLQIIKDTSTIKKGVKVIGYGFDSFTGSSNSDIIPNKKIDSTTVANGIIEFERWDENCISKFFFLNDSANKGMSGGPIFIENKNGLIDVDSKLIGIFHGYFLNKNDNKYYTQATPLLELDDLLNSYYDKK
jgi:hypothetical protein